MQTGTPSLRDLFDAAHDLSGAARERFLADLEPEQRAYLERLLAAADVVTGEGALKVDAAVLVAALDETPAPPLPVSGQQIGPWHLIALIGEGGSSTVFRAVREHAGVRQEAALKLLRRGLYTVEAQRAFRRERQALAQLSHPDIARLIEGGVTENGLAYIVIDFVDGVSITDYVRAHALDLRARLRLFLRVCRAVEAAHRALIVHRDLKPSNVLVSADGHPKLLDFGIAKLLDADDETQTKLPAFTPAYAAPEQRSGALITTATDVYALGILLGELVTGQRLNDGSGRTPSGQVDEQSAAGVLPATPKATRRQLRGDLDNIVLKAIAEEPARRYASAGTLADDIERLLDGRPVVAHPPSRWYRTRKFIQRHRGGVAITALFLLAILASLGLALWQTNIARNEAQRAETERTHAEHEATRANATKDFLIRMFRASDVRVAADKPHEQLTAREILDHSAPKIAQEFKEDPETQIELLGIAVATYRELHQDEPVQTYRAQQLELARKIGGETHPAIIEALIDDTLIATDHGDYPAALKLQEQSDALIRQAGLDRSVYRARWWMIRSQVLLPDPKARDELRPSLDNSVNLYAAVAPRDWGYVQALMLSAYNLHNSNPADSEREFERAATVAEQVHDRNRDDRNLYEIQTGLGTARMLQGKMAEAEEPFRNAIALAEKTQDTTGGNYFLTLANYAGVLHRQGKREPADEVFDRLFKQVTLASKETQNGNDVSVAREMYGDRLAAEGRAADAVPLLELVQRDYIARPNWEGQLRRMRRYLGDAYALVGRSDDARRILKTALDERVAKDKPDYLPLLTLRERWGRFLLSQQDADAAQEQFVEILKQAHERPVESVARAHAGLAKIALDHGDLDGALKASRNALETFDHVTGQHDVRTGPAIWLIHSEVLRASGDTAGARDWAQRALDASRRYDDPAAASIAAAEAAVRAASAQPAS